MATNREIQYGVNLNIGDAKKQLAELQKLARQTNTPQARAAATQLLEQEKRATIAARTESQVRIQLARAESNAKIQADNAATQRIIENERRRSVASRQQAVATRPVGGGGTGSGGFLTADSLRNAAIGGVAGFLTIQGVKALASQATQMADLANQANRAAASFNILSGGADNAERNLLAIQNAAGGTISTLKALEIGNQLAGLGLAKTAEEFGNLTKAAREIVLVSPVINDMGEAITQLALFSANEASFARADQLGLAKGEVQDRMAELMAANDDLDGSQAKLIASTQLLNEKYGAILNTTEAQAQGIEQLRKAWADLNAEMAKGVAPGVNALAGNTAAFINASLGQGDTTLLQRSLQNEINQNISLANTAGVNQSPRMQQEVQGNIRELMELKRVLAEVDQAFLAGADGSKQYRDQVIAMAEAVANGGDVNEEMMQQLALINQWLGAVSDNSGGYVMGAEAQAEAARKAAEAKREDAEATVEAINILSELIARTGEFSSIELPGGEAMRDNLIALQVEIANTGTLTDEQNQAIAEADSKMDEAAAAAQFLGSAEVQAALATGQLNAELLNTPGYLAAVTVEAERAGIAMQQAMALQGQLRTQLASGLGGLIGRGLLDRETAEGILATQQGMITQGANQLSDPNLSPEQRILMQAELTAMLEAPIAQIEEAERQRVEAAREAEAEQKRAIREGEAAQKKAAREAERAFKEAADAAADAFEEAASQLEADLRGVAGLFGTSDVTAEQMAIAGAGGETNFADNFLRRLRDEVENGRDWEGVSEQMGRDALARVGIQALPDPKAMVAQLTEAWASGALFAVEENLALIDRDAVQASLDLKDKARTGQQNIMEMFGLTVDEASQEAVDAMKQQIMAGTLEMTTLEDGRRVPAELLQQELDKVGLTAGGAGLTKEAVSAVQQKVFEQFQAAQQQAGGESPLADGLVNADWGAKASETWDKIRGGFTSDENLQKGLSLGGDIANIIRDGLTNMINTPDWAESIATALFSQVMASVSAQLEAGA